MSLNSGRCMQRGPKWPAARTPCHAATGCGGFQRSAPSGAAAYGMPLNSSRPARASWTPDNAPVSIRTVGTASAAAAHGAEKTSANPRRMRHEHGRAVRMAGCLGRRVEPHLRRSPGGRENIPRPCVDRERTAQPSAFFSSAAMRFSTSAFIALSANAVGHIAPSSSLARSLKPKVA